MFDAPPRRQPPEVMACLLSVHLQIKRMELKFNAKRGGMPSLHISQARAHTERAREFLKPNLGGRIDLAEAKHCLNLAKIRLSAGETNVGT